MSEVVKTKFRAGRYLIPATLSFEDDGRIYCRFKFNRKIIAEMKALDGARWNPDKKCWHFPNTEHNMFQLRYLMGEDVYAPWDREPTEIETTRPLYTHQKEMVAHWLTCHYGIWAAEMGTGKSLAFIEALDHIPDLTDAQGIWYVGPKSGVRAVGLELLKWEANHQPTMMTYENLTKRMKQWKEGAKAPRVVIFDESSKVKTPTSQRSRAAMMLADGVREDWGDNGYVILMSGTPAPKAPTDWFSQCEIARPGFIREGNIHKFKRRLCIIEERESLAGGTYPHIVAWLDDEKRCKVCGEYENHDNHIAENVGDPSWHSFEKAQNEVAYLYERMSGLVMVKFKKDCLDLPEKQYQIIRIKPTPELLRTMKAIKNTAPRVITGLTLMRELSDGFQYVEAKTGFDTQCPRCQGTKEVTVKMPNVEVDTTAPNTGEQSYHDEVITCDVCQGLGVVPQYSREMQEVECPKDEVLKEILDEHDDIGRLVVWGGFTGTVDRITKICRREAWAVLRVDGRGYCGFDHKGNTLPDNELLIAMDASHPRHKELLETYPRLCFVGHPKAGGMALTLTASPTEVFFSNDFDGEARMQAEDRFHRAGMDKNRGATIIDLIHLPTDKYVLDNLKIKKNLQKVSMGDFNKALEEYMNEE